jgi:RNase P subunit RPR2
MIDIDEILTRHGVALPNTDSLRTTCPYCSDRREKSWEKCLQIRPQEWGVRVRCRHCGWRDHLV